MTYDESWDRPHPPGEQLQWQESDCYWFYDRDVGIGGYHRIGQEPNSGTGQLLIFVYKRDGQRFKLNTEVNDADVLERSENAQRVGRSQAESLGDGRMRYQWNEADSSADLEFYEPFYQPRSWMKNENVEEGGAKVKKEMNDGGHLEVSGRIKGTVRIGDNEYSINALAHRDRSWGVRNIDTVYQHRMVTGTVGPKLSWATFIMQLTNGHVAKVGFVAKQGETFDITDMQVIAGFDYDGLTIASAKTRLFLENGETVDIEGDITQGFAAVSKGLLLSVHHFQEVEHQGQSGFTVVDASNRPSRGDYVPSQAEVSMVCMEQGLSATPDYRKLR